jgi:hypothetical protein
LSIWCHSHVSGWQAGQPAKVSIEPSQGATRPGPISVLLFTLRSLLLDFLRISEHREHKDRTIVNAQIGAS